ncbi:MAG: hypothetical protein QNK11_06200 [Legionella sp.]|nr:hypothetical protein [Legionella sp.]
MPKLFKLKNKNLAYLHEKLLGLGPVQKNPPEKRKVQKSTIEEDM